MTRAQPLSFGALLALGVNGIVGVGIFFAPREVAALAPGTTGLWAYALTALLLVPIAGVYASLGSRFAEDGGPYVWAREAFGGSAGFLVGWIAAVSALFSTSAVMAGLATHAGPLVGASAPVARAAFGVFLCFVLAAIAFTGLRPSSWVWSTLTLLKLAPLVALVLAFFSAGEPAAAASEAAVVSLPRAMLVVLFALQGFEIVVVPAGNAPRSGSGVAAATVLALLGAALLYVALHAACLSVPNLAQSAAPLVDAAARHGGRGLSRTVSVATNVSALGIAFGMFAMTPRYLAALGTDAGLGAWLGRESQRQVPTRALAITLGVVAMLVVGPRLEQLFVLSSVAVVLQYSVSAAALVRLALTRTRGLGPRHLVLAGLSLAPVVLAATAASPRELLVAFGALLLGGVVWGIRRFFGSRTR
ncbi:MAG: APC family permease [Polyangiaceae bacterium]